ncbi:isoflavone reductase homolog isoform X1 [Prunus yedoensis var. nudiflora]|uniref:Isoflavone reductase homolog isoform X1 n=1 Tax=Prunus yedoensis var. nudiflora TaxID=2094558 RepID=A0A314YCU5_PRUYE|nr:isoflavone reductase homolog isoform X1 [Prunus yedoensis var. nudiflora]
MGKSKVLMVGGTGYMGRRKASLAQGHQTYILQRPEVGLDIDKLQMLLAFKKQGAHLVEGSFSDFQSLVDAVKLVDVVILHNRFFPSEFGLDPARMGHGLEPGRVTFDEKMMERKAIQDAKNPFTYVCAAGFAGYFAGNLLQMGTLVPPREKVLIYGDGNSKGTSY